ncbi:MAG: GWxTD domain-containing protein, partial [Candidatus Krumholzibacteria bacterium]|nr:GWxTD domain-containing protein [Candidatus Krumholzibacteria bacterium]
MRATIAVLAALLVVFSTGVCSAAKEYRVSREELDRMSPEMRETFAGLHYFFNPYQTKQFLSLPTDDERVAWVERFWKQRDPTPTTPENAMEIEHNIRVKLARDAYGSKKWPGWDKRGEVFIRYGPPNYRGKVWAEINVRGMEPPGELWFYTRHQMLVSFQNFGLKGDFIYSIDPLGPAEKFSPELTEFLLYDTDTALSQQIPQQYLEYYSAPAYAAVPVTVEPGREEGFRMDRPRELDAAIDALMDPDRIDMVPKNVSNIFHKDKIREVANNFEIVLEETPSSYPFNFERKELPFYFSVDQFRGGPETNRVDISIEVPVVIDEDGETPAGETYHAEAVIWDADYNQIARRETDIIVRAQADVTDFSSLIPTQLMVGLPRGYYRMGISVEGKTSQRSSSYRTAFSCEPYGVQLAISDIMFASRIEKVENPSIFTRGPLDVV